VVALSNGRRSLLVAVFVWTAPLSRTLALLLRIATTKRARAIVSKIDNNILKENVEERTLANLMKAFGNVGGAGAGLFTPNVQRIGKPAQRYCQQLCTGGSSGGDFGDTDSVNEDRSAEDFSEHRRAVQEPPLPRCRLHQFVNHRQSGDPRTTALGALRSQADRGNRRFDRIERPRVNPMATSRPKTLAIASGNARRPSIPPTVPSDPRGLPLAA
jgi:hypothetical protein